MMKLGDAVLSTTVDDETILLDPESGRYYGLNPVASRMLSLLLSEPGTEEILQTLGREYDAPQEQLRTDLSGLVRDLEGRGLLRHAP